MSLLILHVTIESAICFGRYIVVRDNKSKLELVGIRFDFNFTLGTRFGVFFDREDCLILCAVRQSYEVGLTLVAIFVVIALFFEISQVRFAKGAPWRALGQEILLALQELLVGKWGVWEFYYSVWICIHIRESVVAFFTFQTA